MKILKLHNRKSQSIVKNKREKRAERKPKFLAMFLEPEFKTVNQICCYYKTKKFLTTLPREKIAREGTKKIYL
jgi:hypothetical protein